MLPHKELINIQNQRREATLALAQKVRKLVAREEHGMEHLDVEENLALAIWKEKPNVLEAIEKKAIQPFIGCQRLIANLLSGVNKSINEALERLGVRSNQEILFLILQLNALAPEGWAPNVVNIRSIPADSVQQRLLNETACFDLAPAAIDGLVLLLKQRALWTAKEKGIDRSPALDVVTLFRAYVGTKGTLLLSEALAHDGGRFFTSEFGYLANPTMAEWVAPLREEGFLNPAIANEQQWDAALSRGIADPYQVPSAPLAVSLEELNEVVGRLQEKTESSQLAVSNRAVGFTQRAIEAITGFQKMEYASIPLRFKKEIITLIAHLGNLENVLVPIDVNSHAFLGEGLPPVEEMMVGRKQYIFTSQSKEPGEVMFVHLNSEQDERHIEPALLDSLTQLKTARQNKDYTCLSSLFGNRPTYVIFFSTDTESRSKQVNEVVYYNSEGTYNVSNPSGFDTKAWREAFKFPELSTSTSGIYQALSLETRRLLDIRLGLNGQIWYLNPLTASYDLLFHAMNEYTQEPNMVDSSSRTLCLLNQEACQQAKALATEMSVVREALLEVYWRVIAAEVYRHSLQYNRTVSIPMDRGLEVDASLHDEKIALAGYKKRKEAADIKTLMAYVSVSLGGEGYGLFKMSGSGRIERLMEDTSALSHFVEQALHGYASYVLEGEQFYFVDPLACSRVEGSLVLCLQSIFSSVAAFRLTTGEEYNHIKKEKLDDPTEPHVSWVENTPFAHMPRVLTITPNNSLFFACHEGMNRSQTFQAFAYALRRRGGKSHVQGWESGFHIANDHYCNLDTSNIYGYIHGTILRFGSEGEWLHQNFFKTAGRLKGIRDFGAVAETLHINPSNLESQIEIKNTEYERQFLTMMMDAFLSNAVLEASREVPSVFVFFARAVPALAERLVRVIDSLGLTVTEQEKVKQYMHVIGLNTPDTISRAGGRDELAFYGETHPGIPSYEMTRDFISMLRHFDVYEQCAQMTSFDDSFCKTVTASYAQSQHNKSDYLDSPPPHYTSKDIRDMRHLAADVAWSLEERCNYLFPNESMVEALAIHAERKSIWPDRLGFLSSEITLIQNKLDVLNGMASEVRWALTEKMPLIVKRANRCCAHLQSWCATKFSDALDVYGAITSPTASEVIERRRTSPMPIGDHDELESRSQTSIPLPMVNEVIAHISPLDVHVPVSMVLDQTPVLGETSVTARLETNERTKVQPSNIGKSSAFSSGSLNADFKAAIIQRLTAYIGRVENGPKDFTYNTWILRHCFQTSQYQNRQANAALARALRTELQSNSSTVQAVFAQDLKRLRQGKYPLGLFINHGINSRELNEIIRDAKRGPLEEHSATASCCL